jgi:hypothetical protein
MTGNPPGLKPSARQTLRFDKGGSLKRSYFSVGMAGIAHNFDVIERLKWSGY